MPDPANWYFQTNNNRRGWGSEEQQYYSAGRSKNARLEGGHLVIEAHRDGGEVADRADYGGQPYTSARLMNARGLGWQYGYMEVRARFTCGRGTWPAIWLLPSHEPINWPMGGEIDVMEHVGYDPGVLHATVHTGAYNHVKKTSKGKMMTSADLCGSFRTYQLKWTADRIEIGVDGVNYFAYDNDHGGKQETWPFDKPFGVLLNLAIGGKWGGMKGIDDDALPQRMEVDFVRVFQRSH